MKIGDMIRDLTTPNVSRQRKNEIIRLLNELGDREEKYKSWLQFFDSGINPEATRKLLDRNPYFVHWFEPSMPAMFDIPNVTWTPLDLSDARLTIRNDHPCVVRMEGTKIYPSLIGSYVFISGRILWNTYEPGYRSAGIAYYDSSGTLIVRRSLNDVKGISPNGTSVLLSNERPVTSDESTDLNQYFRIEVHQSSGVTLGVAGIDLSIELSFY